MIRIIIYVFGAIIVVGCGGGKKSEDYFNEVTVFSSDNLSYFKYSDGLVYDFRFQVGVGDFDDFAEEGFDPYTLTDNQMIFEDSYRVIGESLPLTGTIHDYDVLIDSDFMVCVDINTGRVPCSTYLDPNAEFSEGALLYPYTSYLPGGFEWEWYFINEVALNDIKQALLSN